jgi:hypothetical protein
MHDSSNDWWPIEHAIKREGHKVIGWDGREMNTVEYSPPSRGGINDQIEYPESWVQISDSGRATSFSPTHFLPLPDPPKL